MKKSGNIVSYTVEELASLPSETDRAKVDSISDVELEELIRNDPDDFYLTDAELADPFLTYPVDVKELRRRLGLTQEAFAARYGFSLDTVRGWELGRSRPFGPEQILLQVIDREPEAVERALGCKPRAP